MPNCAFPAMVKGGRNSNSLILNSAFSTKKISLIVYLLIVLSLGGADFFFSQKSYSIINDRLFFGSTGNNTLAIIFSLVILTILFFIVRQKSSSHMFFSAVAGGASINMLERITYGGAVDYIQILTLPVFNIADIFIVGGILLLSLDLLFNKKTLRRENFC